MQNRLKPGLLLNEQGNLAQAGYATSLVLDYQRSQIKAKGYRIKEWDYYLIYNQKFGIALTVADISYIGMLSVSFIDFENNSFITKSKILPLTFGNIQMPSSSINGNINVIKGDFSFSFTHENKGRRLVVTYPDFSGKEKFKCDIFLGDEPKDSMVIATPFADDAKAFYYNQKINCLPASGFFTIGDQKREFNSENSFGTLDWGRGVWTFKNTWFWGSASGLLNGERLGFNIGYGFGDTSAASENMAFYKGIAHKLNQVTFHIPEKDGQFDYLSPWKFTSNDGRFEMAFNPILDRKDFAKVFMIRTDQHQVFGYFTGNIVLANGQVLEITDFLGFAERVVNHW